MTLFILAMAVTVVLLLIGVPVAFAFGVGALLFSYITGSNISFLLPHGYNTVASFSLLALPLFIFSGFVMAESGISERILNFINAFVGRIKGGLGAVTVISCTLFGAISGSSTAAIAAIGKIMIPRMVKEGYPEGHATGLVACSSVLALLIPPSIPMIIFSITSGISVGAAFLSTIVPGLLLALWYCVLNHLILRNEQGIQVHKPKSYKAQFQNIQQTGRKATFALLMPIIILGTIYSGLATPTEAASIAVVYSVVIGLMVYKGISFKQLMDITVSSVAMTGSIIAVLFFLFVMSRAMVFQQIPNQIADALLQISDNKLVLLLLINVLLMLIGMIVDDISGSILAAVIFLPIINTNLEN